MCVCMCLFGSLVLVSCGSVSPTTKSDANTATVDACVAISAAQVCGATYCNRSDLSDGCGGHVTCDDTCTGTNICGENGFGITGQCGPDCRWLTGWGYRQSFTISNTGGTVTNVQVQLPMNTSILVGEGKMLADGGDIRVTKSDGLTLVPYVIESGINTGQTSLWVKVDTLPAGISTLYLYYGNAAASSQSNPAGVWVQNVIGNSSFESGGLWSTSSATNGCAGSWSFPSSGFATDGTNGAFATIGRGGANPNGCGINLYQAVVLPAGSYLVRYDFYQLLFSGARSILYVCPDVGCVSTIGFNTSLAIGAYINQETSPVSGTPTITFFLSLEGDLGGGGTGAGWIDNVRLRKAVTPRPTAAGNLDEMTPRCP